MSGLIRAIVLLACTVVLAVGAGLASAELGADRGVAVLIAIAVGVVFTACDIGGAHARRRRDRKASR